MFKLANEFTRAVAGMANDLVVGLASEITQPVMSALMKKHLRDLPGGTDLMQQAKALGVDVKVASTLDMRRHVDGEYGGIYNRNNPAARGISVKNSMKPRHMASVFLHELQHMVQDAEMGIPFSNAPNFAQAGHYLFSTLLTEADAFTQQAISAIKAKTTMGNAGPLERMMRADGFNPGVRDVLRSFDFDGFVDHRALARQIFTYHLMELPGYKGNFLSFYVHHLEATALTREDFIKSQDNLPSINTDPTDNLKKEYGQPFADQVNMRALRVQVMRSLSMPERMAIRQMENLGRNAHAMTDKEYSDARRHLIHAIKAIFDPEAILERAASSDKKRVYAHKDNMMLMAAQKQPAATLKAPAPPAPRPAKS